MRNTLIALFAMTLISCGGGGGGNIDVTLSPTMPSSMSTLSSGLKAMGAIYTSTDADAAIIAGPAEGAFSAGSYTFNLTQNGSLPSEGAVFEADFYYGDVLVALVIRQIHSIGETITVGETDFDTSMDSDSDGVPNLNEIVLGLDPTNPDTDGDGVPDGVDAFPSVSAEWADMDGDGIGDNSDDDIDGDGLSNSDELLYGTDPKNPDSDGDGIMDGSDNCKTVSNADQFDTDGDGRGDACEDDTDGDGLTDAQEATYHTNKLLADTDGDGLGDLTEINLGTNPLLRDTDGDGIIDGLDNCPKNANADQLDTDGDGIGDVCDSDKDNDGIPNGADNCPLVRNADQADQDGDGIGDACDPDIDGDGIPNAGDNCPYVSNPAQSATDADNDGVAIDCDLDETDPHVGAKESAVFVDIAHGADTNSGTMNAPLASISAAITKAKAQGKKIYVAAGTYDVSSVVWQNGIGIFGGFKNSADPADRFSSRNSESGDVSFKTLFTNSAADVTIFTSGVTNLVIGGFHIENASATADPIEGSRTVEISGGSVTLDRNTISGNTAITRSAAVAATTNASLILTRNVIDGGGMDGIGSVSTGILIENATGKVTNNIIKAGGARFVTGVELQNSPSILANNTLDARAGNVSLGSAEGLVFNSSSPVVVNNLIFAGNARDLYTLECEGTAPDSTSIFKNNLLSIFSADPAQVYARDCDGNVYLSAAFTMGAADVSGNIVYNTTENLANLINVVTYGLVGGGGNDGVNDGLDASDPTLGSVTSDYHGTARPQGAAYDIGAVEKI